MIPVLADEDIISCCDPSTCFIKVEVGILKNVSSIEVKRALVIVRVCLSAGKVVD